MNQSSPIPDSHASQRNDLPPASDLEALSKIVWDIIVIGAGTGGTTAAIRLAQQGRRVLLVEAKPFPRDKVCGGCLNQRAWRMLGELHSSSESISNQILRANAQIVDRMRLLCQSRAVEWNVPPMYSITRRTLDDLMVKTAVESGVVFCPETTAKVAPEQNPDHRLVQVQHHGQLSTLRSRLVIAADGLGSHSLSELPMAPKKILPHSRIGVGAILDARQLHVDSSQLTMAVGAGGYVGLAMAEDEKLNLAAAIDADLLKSLGPAESIASILRQCHHAIPSGLNEVKWTGTLPLTRQSSTVALPRILLIGDSTSYVEPFTGEGMSWSIFDAFQVSELIREHDLNNCDALEKNWRHIWSQHVRNKQWVCAGLARLLRHPQLAGYALVLARVVPWIPQWIIARTSRSVTIARGATV